MPHDNTHRFAGQNKPQRGVPGFASTQREKILALLRQAGPGGVSRESLIFEYRWTQCGARIDELQDMGYTIRHDSRHGERFVRYVLESEPLELKPLPSVSDWYAEKFGARPTTTTPELTADLPLFSGVAP